MGLNLAYPAARVNRVIIAKYFTAEILMKDFTVDNETARVLRTRGHLPFSGAHRSGIFRNPGSASGGPKVDLFRIRGVVQESR
jgi:hypothetical protein